MELINPPTTKDPNWRSGESSWTKPATSSMTLGLHQVVNFSKVKMLKVDSGMQIWRPSYLCDSYGPWFFHTHSTSRKGSVFFWLFSGLEFHIPRSSWRENVWNGSKEAQWYDTKQSNWLVGLGIGFFFGGGVHSLEFHWISWTRVGGNSNMFFYFLPPTNWGNDPIWV